MVETPARASLVCPVRMWITCCSSMSHTVTMPSWLPTTSSFSSRLHAIAVMPAAHRRQQGEHQSSYMSAQPRGPLTDRHSTDRETESGSGSVPVQSHTPRRSQSQDANPELSDTRLRSRPSCLCCSWERNHSLVTSVSLAQCSLPRGDSATQTGTLHCYVRER